MAKAPNWPLILAAGISGTLAVGYVIGRLAGVWPTYISTFAFVLLFLALWLVLWAVRDARHARSWPLLIAGVGTVPLTIEYAVRRGEFGVILLLNALYYLVLFLLIGLSVRAAWRLYWRATHRAAG